MKLMFLLSLWLLWSKWFSSCGETLKRWCSTKLLILLTKYVVRCAIWYHLYNLKNVKSTHGGVLLLILKVTLLHGCFSCSLNRTNATKSCKASHMVLLYRCNENVFISYRSIDIIEWHNFLTPQLQLAKVFRTKVGTSLRPTWYNDRFKKWSKNLILSRMQWDCIGKQIQSDCGTGGCSDCFRYPEVFLAVKFSLLAGVAETF